MNDIGTAVNSAAYMKRLVRIEHGPFHTLDCVPLASLDIRTIERGLERGKGVMAAFRNKNRLREIMKEKLNENTKPPSPPQQAAPNPLSPLRNDRRV